MKILSFAVRCRFADKTNEFHLRILQKCRGGFVELTTDSEKYAFRIHQYHFGVDKIRSKNIVVFLCAKAFGEISPAIQRICGIKRNTDLCIAYGSNWVSITDDFVHYLLNCKEDTLHRYKHSKCADELFLQTILYNSPFRDRLYLTSDGKTCNMRAIEWDKSGCMRGTLRTYQESDFRKLIDSPMLFARKFSSHNITIVNKLISYIKSQS